MKRTETHKSKRFLSLLLALALLCTALPKLSLSARAEDEPVYSGTCGENLNWTLDPETGLLTISGEGKMSNNSPFAFRNDVKRAVILSGVTSIGEFAFYECASLTSVTVAGSVTSIDMSAFFHCSSLTSVELQEGLTSVGESAFYLCGALTSVSIPASVQTIGHQAFGYLYGQPGNEVTVEGFTVYGYTNSAAQTYAEENGFAFVSLGGNPCANGHEFKNGVCVHCGYAASSASEIFTDVKAGVYYDSAVLWAIRNGITGGTGDGKFSPKGTCKREQVMTFLYAAAGKPEHHQEINPFTDVKKKYYYNPVMWAVENKITSGTSATTFGVGKPCTREQVVTFLWKAAGSPEPTSTECRFTDVNPKKYYYKAILWALESKITGGMSAAKFGVGKTCTRAQIVTFLYKAYGKQAPADADSSLLPE